MRVADTEARTDDIRDQRHVLELPGEEDDS